MNLLLTSSGISGDSLRSDFRDMFSEGVRAKVALIFTWRQAGDEQWLPHYHAELDSLGAGYADVNISEDADLSGIGPFDGYYVCGGNTFYILDRMRKTGLDRLLKSEIALGKPYVGVSAGSIIAGPDIEIAGWGESGDENDIGLADLSGLGFTDRIVAPHYEDSMETDVQAFELRRGVAVVRLRDGEGIRMR